MPTNVCTTTTANGVTCTTCTGQPLVPHVPPHIVEEPVLAWDSGANSGLTGDGAIKTLNGDLHVVFTVSPSGGIVLGLALPPREAVHDPTTIAYGWYTTAVNGQLFAQPMEHGVLLHTPVSIRPSNRLEVRRVEGVVSYRINGTEIYVSVTSSHGALLAGVCLFTSGDTVQ